MLSTYWKVKEIIQRQVILVEEYQRTWNRVKTDPHFTARELRQIYNNYAAILSESLMNLDQLALATNAFVAQMTDGKRIALIDRAGRYIEKNLSDLRKFNDQNIRLSLSRATDLADMLLTKKLYGIN